MNSDHWILLGAWLLFGLVHSLLAAEWFVSFWRRVMGSRFIYYRLVYSLIALLSLAGVLVWQFSVKSTTLGPFPILKWLIGLPAGDLGIFLMGISVRKYFFSLSGISALWKKGDPALPETGDQPSLQTEGVHRFVRHPLYFGTLLFIWSLFLFFPLLSNLLACIMITLYTLAGIQLEERKLVKLFGKHYAEYRRKVPMLIPGSKSGSSHLRSDLNP